MNAQFALDTQQQAVVDSDSKSILAVATAGSGKTTTLVMRVARILASGVHPSRIVVVTFTNAAARNLVRRLRDLGAMDPGQSLGACCTLHALCMKLLQRHAKQFGFGSRITVLDKEASEALLLKAAKGSGYKGSKEKLFEQAKRGPFAPVETTDEAIAVQGYQQRMRQSGIVDFDSLLHYGLRIARTGGAQYWSHLFVDEFQDSGDLDAAIYEAIGIENKFFVADSDQSIFAFRGGNVAHMLKLAESPGVSVLKIETNYRSDIAICQAAQRLIEHNTNRIKKVTWPKSQNFGRVAVREYANGIQECVGISQMIELIGHKDVAVLVRTNPMVEFVSQQLAAAGIPVARRGGGISGEVNLPPDWRRTRTLLALLSNPNNDALAETWIEKYEGGEGMARSMRLKALGQAKSINATYLCLPEVTDADAALLAMEKNRVSVESIDTLRRLRGTLPDGGTLQDLALAASGVWNDQFQESAGVTVSTIHSAKGLEFPVVFLPGFEEAIMPGTNADELEEMRRLAFVAVTRAKHELHISWARERQNPFNKTRELCQPSRFIAEMGL